MQDRHSPQTRKSLLATHGRTIHWVKGDPRAPSYLSVNVRFAPKADIAHRICLRRFVPKADSCTAAKAHRYSIISSGRVRSVAGTAPLGADKSQQSLLTTCGTY